MIKSKATKKKSKKEIFLQVYPAKKYDDNRFRKIQADLLSLFEQFLANERFQNKNLSQINSLLKELSERKIEKLYKKTLNRASRFTENSYSKSSDFYYQQFILQSNIFSLTTTFERKMKSKEDITDFNVPQISYNLDLFYVIQKLRNYCIILSYKNIHSQEVVKINFIDEIIRIVEDSALLKNKVVEIYYLIYKTYQDEENENHYFKLKVLIDKYLDIFPLLEAKEIFEAAFNYCIKRGNLGSIEFQSEVLLLYQTALKSGFLLINNELSPTSYRNILVYALRFGSIAWAKKFVDQYSSKLNPKYIKSITFYGKALISFYEKEFGNVLYHLNNYEYDEINFTLGAKSLQLASYFELEESDALYSFMDSFKIYLKRKKEIPKSREVHYLNLIAFTNEMMKFKNSKKISLSQLKKQIETTRTASKQWLLEKVDRLIKQN